jgi:beta-glucanase (GH16 family)
MYMKKSIILLSAVIVTVGMISCLDNKREDEKYRKGWTLVWEDDFNGSSPDANTWSKLPKGKGFTNRFMSSDDAVIRFHEGNLVLLGLKNPTENAEQPFITGGITTAGNKKLARASRIEARLRTIANPGAIYYMSLLPVDKSEETENIFVNVMTRYGNDLFIYNEVSSDYTQKMKENPPALTLAGVNPDNYHTFVIERYPDSLVFYVNSLRTKMYPRILTEMEGQFPYNDRDFDLAFGVSLRNDANPDNLPAYMFIDWVRYYERNEE